MTGWVSPACAATSVNCARNGRPDGLPRGCGLTPRDEIPWPKATPAGNAISPRSARRVSPSRPLPECPRLDDTFGLLDDDEAIGRQVAERLLLPRGPRDLHGVCLLCAAEAKVQPEIVLRVVAGSAPHVAGVGPPAARQPHARADGRAVRRRSHAPDQHRVVPV